MGSLFGNRSDAQVRTVNVRSNDADTSAMLPFLRQSERDQSRLAPVSWLDLPESVRDVVTTCLVKKYFPPGWTVFSHSSFSRI